jgi:hypothetical protein
MSSATRNMQAFEAAASTSLDVHHTLLCGYLSPRSGTNILPRPKKCVDDSASFNQQCPVAWTDLAWTLQCCSPRQSYACQASSGGKDQKRSTTGARQHSDLQSTTIWPLAPAALRAILSWQRSRLPNGLFRKDAPSGGSSPRLCAIAYILSSPLFMQATCSEVTEIRTHAPCAKVLASVYHSHCSMCAPVHTAVMWWLSLGKGMLPLHAKSVL